RLRQRELVVQQRRIQLLEQLVRRRLRRRRRGRRRGRGPVMDVTLIVVLVIALALFFDFTNGFHDTANAMATPIATGALRPRVAVALAAVLNLVGAFLSTEVSKTISHGIIREDQITPVDFIPIIFAGLIGAITW